MNLLQLQEAIRQAIKEGARVDIPVCVGKMVKDEVIIGPEITMAGLGCNNEFYIICQDAKLVYQNPERN